MDQNQSIPKSQGQGPLWEKSFQLGVRTIRLYQYLTVAKKEHVLSRQILRSGTSPGAMVREAKNAESAADFIHKLSLAQKETSETQYWLEILLATDYISKTAFDSLYLDTEEIMKLIRSSILTKKQNQRKK